MAQYRFFNFKDDDRTDWLNRQYQGILPEGLYRGFDFDPVDSVNDTLSLKHDVTGWRETLIDQTQSNWLGLIRTQQGVNVIESNKISITVVPNNNANPRIDLIVCEHEYVASVGGVTAGYVQIQGTPASNPVAPALTFPLKQVVIGQIYWPANSLTIDADGVVYTKANVPYMASHIGFVDFTSYQEVTGTKKFKHTMHGIATMTYDAGSKKLVASALSDHYFLDSVVGQFFNFLEVNRIEIPNIPDVGLNSFTIHTQQRLKFRIDAGNNSNINPVNVEHTYSHHADPNVLNVEPYMMVESGELIRVQDSREDVSDPPIYRLYSDGIHKSSVNKLYRQLIGNKGTGSVDLVKGYVHLNRDGNYYEIAFNWYTLTNANLANAKTIKAISHTNDAWDNLDPNTKAGNIIFVRFVDSSGGVAPLGFSGDATELVLENMASSVSSIDVSYMFGVKKINTGIDSSLAGNSSSANIRVKRNGIVVLIEDVNEWRVIDVIDTTRHKSQLAHYFYKYEQYIEHHWQKLQSQNWVTLGSGTSVFDTSTGDLIVTDNGNHFEATVPAGGVMKDIKVKRLGAPVSLPNGTVLSVRFLHDVYVPGVSTPFAFDLSSGNIRSIVNNWHTGRNPSGTGYLSIWDGDDGVIGDVYLFRKSNNKWDIIAGHEQGAGIWANIQQLISGVDGLNTFLGSQTFYGVWKDIPITGAGWQSHATHKAQYRKSGNGRIQLRGIIETTSTSPATPSTVVATLPSDLLPDPAVAYPRVFSGHTVTVGVSTSTSTVMFHPNNSPITPSVLTVNLGAGNSYATIQTIYLDGIQFDGAV